MPTKPRRRILIPSEHWTGFPNRVFTEELRALKQKRGAVLYLFMIDWAAHQSARVVATCAELASAIGMDERVTKACLDELADNGFIRLEREGVAHSHVNKDCWLIPAAEKDARADGWTPVPRFVVRNYLPACHSSVLLVLLIYFQHLSMNNRCWMGVKKLSNMLGWSATRVRDALRTIATNAGWNKMNTGLPKPASFTTVPRSNKTASSYSPTVRHYRVLGIQYSSHQKQWLRRMFVPEQFRAVFGIELGADLREQLSSIFRYASRKSAVSDVAKNS